MRQWPDLIGQRFGMLVVIGQAESLPPVSGDGHVDTTMEMSISLTVSI